MVVIRGRLTPEVGAVVQRALEAAADRLFREARARRGPSAVADEVTPAQRRADALGLLAESALAADLDRGTAGDRYQVVLHVEAPRPAWRPAANGLSRRPLEVDDGAVDVSAETSRAFPATPRSCVMRQDADGRRAGRRAQDPHRAAVDPPCAQARDTSCRFPGCTARRCDAHHVEHWAEGGPTPPRQPGAAVPAPSSGRARGRIRSDPPRRRGDDLPPSGSHGARRRPAVAGPVHADRRRPQRSWTTSRCGTARLSTSSTLLTCSTHRPRPWQPVERVEFAARYAASAGRPLPGPNSVRRLCLPATTRPTATSPLISSSFSPSASLRC